MKKEKGKITLWAIVFWLISGGMLLASGIYLDKIIVGGFSLAVGLPAIGFGIAGLGILAYILFANK